MEEVSINKDVLHQRPLFLRELNALKTLIRMTVRLTSIQLSNSQLTILNHSIIERSFEILYFI